MFFMAVIFLISILWGAIGSLLGLKTLKLNIISINNGIIQTNVFIISYLIPWYTHTQIQIHTCVYAQILNSLYFYWYLFEEFCVQLLCIILIQTIYSELWCHWWATTNGDNEHISVARLIVCFLVSVKRWPGQCSSSRPNWDHLKKSLNAHDRGDKTDI